MRILITLVVVATLAAVAWIYVSEARQDGSVTYRFAAVERADLAVVTMATGRIEAIDVVEVSSQLSGQVDELFADFNDEVAAGASLARLDDKIFAAAVAEAQAGLAHAEAAQESAMAATKGTAARYEEARLDHERKQALKAKGNISASIAEKARAGMLAAKSQLSAARADESVQKAAIDMARAALRKARIDLERTVIRAPIDGIVIRRSVELGQTVAASLQAPTLFTIAHDLREMRVHAKVDEADIGRIEVGQSARFTVDAYPDRAFSGRVIEIRRAPDIVQNVVTYTVVITTRNPDLALLPGMTALVRIAIIERRNTLLVPNAALRFEPTGGPLAKESSAGPADEMAGRPARVWTRDEDGGVMPVAVGIGASDGSMTEVLAEPLSEGQQVAVGEAIVRAERTLFGLRLGF